MVALDEDVTVRVGFVLAELDVTPPEGDQLSAA